MLKITRDMLPVFDLLEVGISLLTWDSEDLEKMQWVYVNPFRCTMTGFTREEIVSRPINIRSTHQARAIYESQKAHIAEHGSFNCETELLHKDLRSIPIALHMKLVELDGETLLLSEVHDISTYKQTERDLWLSRNSLNEMLGLMAREKAHFIDNIQDNLGRVVFPLLDQLRISASESQNAVLDLLTRRIGDVCREVGLPARAAGPGLHLTRRQILICEMIQDGMTSKEIARILNCSASTVNNHRHTIRRKLNLAGTHDNLQSYLQALGAEK